MHFSTFAARFLESVTSGTPKENERLGLDIAKIVGRNLGLHGVIEFERDGALVLGGGSFGVAGITATDENKVVKLTTDPEEVKAASILVGKRLTHVVEFFTAAQIADIEVRNIHTMKEQRIGITVMERLDEIGIPSDNDIKNRRLNAIVNEVKREFGVEADQILYMSAATARRKLEEASLELAGRLQATGDNDLGEIADGIDELYGYGIYAVDFHRGNVGWSNKDGVYKVFDLGLSSVQKGKRVDVFKNPVERSEEKLCVFMGPEDCWPMRSISAPEHTVPVLY